MGITAAAEAATKSSGSSLTFPILIVLVFVGFYFLMIRPQRRRQQQVAQQQNTVQPVARDLRGTPQGGEARAQSASARPLPGAPGVRAGGREAAPSPQGHRFWAP